MTPFQTICMSPPEKSRASMGPADRGAARSTCAFSVQCPPRASGRHHTSTADRPPVDPAGERNRPPANPGHAGRRRPGIMVPMRLSETDEIAAELYLVPPARFVAAREQVVRQARAAGHRDLARELHALRRPALSAWLVNLLTRHQRARMQQLFAVGRELRQAQTRLDGDRLRRLPAQRQDLIAELLEWAARHAAEAGL